MREVYPGIYVITEKGRLGGLKPAVNIYVITGSNGLIFDAGYGTAGDVKHFIKEYQSIIRLCKDRGRPCTISRILSSHMHPDHFAGLKKIRNQLGISVLLTEKMASLVVSRKTYVASYDNEKLFSDAVNNHFYRKYMIPVLQKIGDIFYSCLYGINFIPDPDMIIDDDTEIDVNGEKWRIFPSPGHASEHISLYDPKRGVLFAGDNVLRTITPWLGPPKSDLEAYIRSLKELRVLPKLQVIFAAHGSPVVDPKKRIQEIIDWRMERLDHVRAIVMKYGRIGVTMKNIIAEIYPGINFIRHMMARGWVELSLQFLENNGEIISRVGKGTVKFFYPAAGKAPAGNENHL